MEISVDHLFLKHPVSATDLLPQVTSDNIVGHVSSSGFGQGHRPLYPSSCQLHVERFNRLYNDKRHLNMRQTRNKSAIC